MANTVASVSKEVDALDKRVSLAEQRLVTIENIISDTNDSLVSIADKLSSISEDLAVIKDREKNKSKDKSFQEFASDLGMYLIKIAILGGLAYYVITKGGF